MGKTNFKPRQQNRILVPELIGPPVSNFLYGSQAHLTPELDKLFILRVFN